MRYRSILVLLAAYGLGISCKKQVDPEPDPIPPASFSLNSLRVDGKFDGFTYTNVRPSPELTLNFSTSLKTDLVKNSIQWKSKAGEAIPYLDHVPKRG